LAAWQQTIDRWHQEGLPEECKDVWGAINQYFHTDDTEYGPSPWVNIGLLPGFEYKVLEEKGNHIVVQDGDGAIAETIRPELGASIPHYLRHAIETRADWEKIRDERLNPDTPGRVPDNLDDLCARTFDADYPTGISGGSVYGWLRNWMGGGEDLRDLLRRSRLDRRDDAPPDGPEAQAVRTSGWKMPDRPEPLVGGYVLQQGLPRLAETLRPVPGPGVQTRHRFPPAGVWL